MPVDLGPEDVEDIKNSEETWVIDFWAEWCGPCKKLAPIYEKVSEKVEGAEFGKVDMTEHQQLGSEMGVRALPTLLILKDGEEVARTSGAMSEQELEAWVNENV